MMAGTTHAANPQAAPPHVAVVVDDRDMLHMLDLALTAAGYRTLRVAHEADAAPAIRHAQPACVVLDLWMEHIDSGVEILHTLHADPTTRAIPVIVASAHPFLRPELRELLRTPHDVFVQKPIPLDDLLHTIATVRAPTAGAAPPSAAERSTP